MAQFSEEKKFIEYKMHVLIFCTILSEKFLIPSRIERDMIKKCRYVPFHVKYSLFYGMTNRCNNMQ